MPRERTKKRKLKIGRMFLLLFLLLLIIGGGTALGFIFGIAKSLPDWQASDLESANNTFVYDKNGALMVQLHREENRTPVELASMPKYLVDAFIATEDVRFYEHYGIDVKRIMGALVADIRHRSYTQGASTLTMQLVRNAILEDQDKKIERKIKEALLAIEVERRYSKDEILGFYLNEIYFGHGANGVQAASQIYFGKDVSQLTLGESAMLAGIIRNPRIYSPYLNPENALHIRNVVLENMVRYQKITQAEADAAKQEELKLSTLDNARAYPHPWFTDYVIDQAEDLLQEAGYDPSQLYTGGFRIYSTMDPLIQIAAEEAYDNSANFPKSSTADLIQSAMAVLDPASGEIRALIGGREHLTKRGLNRATDMKRQPGSSIKPVAVYAPCLENGYSPASVVEDAPVTFGSSAKPYKPENYDGIYRGRISMRAAVKDSVNIPAVKLLNEIGVSTGFNFAQKLGLPLMDPEDRSLSLALGGLTRGVSPLDMAGAYAAFDNQGVYIAPHAISKIVDRTGATLIEITPQKNVVMSEETAYLMTDMLKTVVDEGTGTNAKMNRPVAGKTGTTQLPDKKDFAGLKGNKDAWFAGYTPELVGVVWMGYDNDYDANGQKQYLNKVYGGQLPAKIWKFVMAKALKEAPVTPFPKPAGIVSKAYDTQTGSLPSALTPTRYIKTELFAQANVPKTTSSDWISVTICAESRLLTNKACPKKINAVFIKGSTGELAPPTTYCTLHTGDNVYNPPAEELVAVCTDSAHGGNKFLANIPGKGENGGCPQGSIAFESQDLDHPITDFCPLPNHQVKAKKE